MTSSVSLAELSSAGVLLSHMEAVTIARETALRAAGGELPGVPAPDELRLRDDGQVEGTGEVTRGAEVRRTARLLVALLSQAVENTPAPESFRHTLARAFPGDEAEYESLEEFTAALAPFAAPNPETIVQQVVSRWRVTKGIDDPLDEFAAETPGADLPAATAAALSREPSSQVTPPAAAERPVSPEPRIDRPPLVAPQPAPLVAPESGPLVAPPSAPLVPPESGPVVAPQPTPIVGPQSVPPIPLSFSAASTASKADSPALAVAESPVEVHAGDLPLHRDLADVPLRDSRELALLPQERRQRGGWILGVVFAALLAGLLPALWSVSRPWLVPVEPDPAPVEQTERAVPAPQGEAPVPRRDSEAPASNASAAPKGEALNSHPSDGPATSERPASQSKSTGTSGVISNESPAGMAGETGPAELIPDSAFSPSFASAVSGMFYHSGTGPGSAIMRADTDKTGVVLGVTSIIDDRGSNFHPRPSPDGKWLAFDSDRDGERGIYLSDANGQGVRRVSGPGFAAVPSWSPDGRRLAFVRSEPGRPRVWNIWILEVATGDSRRITSHRLGQPWGASWFPDGQRIAYSHEDRLIVRTLEGNNVRVYNSPISGRLIRTPAVSPDGKRIIFQVRRSGAWMLDLSDGSMSRVMEDASAEEFTWSPDGRRVAYHSRRSGEWGVWVTAPRGH